MNAFNGCKQSTGWVSCAALALMLAACASNKRDASTRSVTPSSPSNATLTTARDRETTIQISKALRERCRLPDEQVAAPRFDFNQATLRAQGRNVLDDIANCLKDGPLSDEVITLVGRTDSSGSERHNASLGESRASAARNYLAQRGVSADRMRLLSRGEQGARGDSEATSALDRRVDVELGDLQNSPILEGSMLQAETSRARVPTNSAAASYADTAEGGKPVNSASPSADSGSSSGSSAEGSGSAP